MVRAWWQMLRGKFDRGCHICPASKRKAWPQGLMYSFQKNDGDRWGKLSRRRRQSFSHAAGLYLVVQLGFWRERGAVLWANCFNSDKIVKNLIETLIWIGHIFILCFKIGVKALWLIFHSNIINLVYPFFVGILIAVVRLIWLVWLTQRGLIKRAGLTRCTFIGRIIGCARIEKRW